MKKTFKISGIIALAVVIGFFMTACPDDKGGPEEPKSFITVTGIPSDYIGKIAAVKLSPLNSSEITVYSTEEKINETSRELPLYNWADSKPWIGSGSFSITIFIFQDKTAAAGGQKTDAGIADITITEATTAIGWSSFTKK